MVYKFKDFNDFSQKSFIGLWDLLGKENKLKFYSSDVVTSDIKQSVKNDQKLLFTYSVLESEVWITKLIKYLNPFEFLYYLSDY